MEGEGRSQVPRQLDVERIDRILAALEENADAIEAMIRLVGELKKSGLLDALLALAEMGDEIFSSLARPEVMKALGNAMALVYLLSRVDQEVLIALAEAAPDCIAKAREAAREDRPMSIRELLRLMTSPEMARLLRTARALGGCRAGQA